MDLIHKVQRRDTSYTTFNAEIGQKCNRKEAARHYNWELDLIGLLYKDSKVWVLYKANLQQKIFIKNYNDSLSGHYSLAKTVELLLYKYY